MIIDQELCTLCGECIANCFKDAIAAENEKILISEECVDCRQCVAAEACPVEAILPQDTPVAGGGAECFSCPVRCTIKPERTGACQRYLNQDGGLLRTTPLTPYHEVEELVSEEYDPAIRKPLLTGIGACTTSRNPPAPFIVQDKVEGVDVVTCVSEIPFTFSGVQVKIDTDRYIGEEGSKVLYRGKRAGMVVTEQYGSKILSLGGVRALAHPEGWRVARLCADIANRKSVELEIEGGGKLELAVGEKPVIDGEQDQRRRIGCGGAATQLNIEHFRGAADEVIIMDQHLTGYLRKPASDTPWEVESITGIKMRHRAACGHISFPHQGGVGYGATIYEDPLQIIESYDPADIKEGWTILFTDCVGEKFALYRFEGDSFKETDMTPEAMKSIEELQTGCEPARVSALFFAGVGGSARTGVVKRRHIRLTEAIKDRRARLTVGGARAFVFPGGGIDILVDVEKVREGAFHWMGVMPAMIAPIEFTMKLDDYVDIGGYAEAVRPLEEVLRDPPPVYVSPGSESQYAIRVKTSG